MQQQDLQQISDLMDKKLDQKFKENNKILKEEIVDEIGVITNQGFNEQEERMTARFEKVDARFEKVDERFNKADDEFKKINDKCDNIYERICDKTDIKLRDLELDMDKVKYIHLKEWDKLPPTYEISEALAEKNLKKKM